MLAQRIFAELNQVNALLIGAGEMIQLVAQHLKEVGVKEITIANRTIDNAIDLANSLSGHAMLLADIPEELHRFDIVISSTGSQLPILGKGTVEQALKQRKRQPMFLVDIAVPRDIETQVADLPDAYLYSVDDLKDIIDHNKQLRAKEADKAQLIIAEGVAAFTEEHQQRQASDLLVAYREYVTDLSNEELQRAVQQLNAGQSAEQVLENFAHGLSRKIMHGPTIAMREAAGKQEHAILEAAKRLFSLDKD
jgi:glutamyl-tRNA reductase